MYGLPQFIIGWQSTNFFSAKISYFFLKENCVEVIRFSTGFLHLYNSLAKNTRSISISSKRRSPDYGK